MKIRFAPWGDRRMWEWDVNGDTRPYYSWKEPLRPFPDDKYESVIYWLEQFLNSNKLES